MQMTNFEYEILIHDDASTDRTADIIREYESKYPDIIKPIYQTENQYSKGISMNATFNWPRAQGKYIALCEGDDYWTDPLKLQKQVDFMEAHPECSMCIHAVQVVGVNGVKKDRVIRPHNTHTIVTTKDFLLARGWNFHTSSIVFCKCLMENPPQWYIEAPAGDYPLALICSNRGDVYYINEIMSAYRFFIPDSWTERLNNGNRIEQKQYQIAKIKMLKDFNHYSDKKFNEIIHNQIFENEKAYLLLHENPICLKDQYNQDILRRLTFLEQKKFYFKLFMPRLYHLLVQIKRVLINYRSTTR